MKLKSIICPNCNAPLEPISGKPMMFCPYCGNKISQTDIEFYKEDSKTARLETVTNTVKSIIGTKEQRDTETERKEELLHKKAEDARRKAPYFVLLLIIVFVLLALAEHYGW